MSDWIAKARQGQPRAIARLITQLENSDEAAQQIITALYSQTGQAHIVGVTGAPGSGKSTLVNELAKAYRRQDKKVGIIAVDPSSPFTGGALLGDRVRMRDLSGDSGIFIRSMASRGSLGGLSRATAAAAKVLDAAGFDLILIETVGAGQAEVDIAGAAHTTLVIEAPGMGDDIQSIKAGILEIADILVVNKADRPGAARTVRSLKTMLQLGPTGGTRHHGRIITTPTPAEVDESVWQIPVQETVSTDGTGIEALVATIQAHHSHLHATNGWLVREKERSRREVLALLNYRFMARLETAVSANARDDLITAVARRELDPYTAVDKLFSSMK